MDMRELVLTEVRAQELLSTLPETGNPGAVERSVPSKSYTPWGLPGRRG